MHDPEAGLPMRVSCRCRRYAFPLTLLWLTGILRITHHYSRALLWLRRRELCLHDIFSIGTE